MILLVNKLLEKSLTYAQRQLVLFLILCISVSNSCNNPPKIASKGYPSSLSQPFNKTTIVKLLGRGYDPLHDVFRGRCIKKQTPFSLEVKKNHLYAITKISNYDDLLRELNLNLTELLQVGKGGLNEQKSRFVVNTPLTQYETHILVKRRISHSQWHLQTYELKEKHNEYLRKYGMTSFNHRCGTEYINGIEIGQEDFLLFTFNLSIEAKNNVFRKILDLENEASQSEKSFWAILKQLSTHKTSLLSMYDTKQGSLQKVSPTSKEVGEIIEKFKNGLQKNSFSPISFNFASYSVQKTATQVKSRANQYATQQLLSQLQTRYFAMLKHKADLRYIRSNGQIFEDQSLAYLNENENEIDGYLNQVKRFIILCTQKPATYCKTAKHFLVKLPNINPLPIKRSIEKFQTNMRTCAQPVYNLARGTACGIAAYQTKRSPFCGAELFKYAQNKLCIGYLPPLGPKVLEELSSKEENKQDQLTEKFHAHYDKKCQEKFGKDWQFSDINSDAGMGPLAKGFTAGLRANRKFINCVRIAKVAYCRHPIHGVELYKKCAHEQHGIALYKQCRLPEFGLDHIEEKACINNLKMKDPLPRNAGMHWTQSVY